MFFSFYICLFFSLRQVRPASHDGTSLAGLFTSPFLFWSFWKCSKTKNATRCRCGRNSAGLRYTDRTEEVGSVICLWTLSRARVWTRFFSTLACTSREMSGDVWLILKPDSRTGTAKGGHDGSFTNSSSLSSLSSPSTCKGIDCITRSVVDMWKMCCFFSPQYWWLQNVKCWLTMYYIVLQILYKFFFYFQLFTSVDKTVNKLPMYQNSLNLHSLQQKLHVLSHFIHNSPLWCLTKCLILPQI